MRLSLRLILFLVVGITLVTFLVARNQVRGEKRGLRADLERRAGILAESLARDHRARAGARFARFAEATLSSGTAIENALRV